MSSASSRPLNHIQERLGIPRDEAPIKYAFLLRADAEREERNKTAGFRRADNPEPHGFELRLAQELREEYRLTRREIAVGMHMISGRSIEEEEANFLGFIKRRTIYYFGVHEKLTPEYPNKKPTADQLVEAAAYARRKQLLFMIERRLAELAYTALRVERRNHEAAGVAKKHELGSEKISDAAMMACEQFAEERHLPRKAVVDILNTAKEFGIPFDKVEPLLNRFDLNFLLGYMEKVDKQGFEEELRELAARQALARITVSA